MRHHLTDDGIFAFIESGTGLINGDKSVDTIAKAHESATAAVSVGLMCMSKLCNLNEDFDPVKTNLATLF